jgi:predicted unusual protein kinase regulating ubiquinone biosynthesis (AarF/ABC1/UbiB family)
MRSKPRFARLGTGMLETRKILLTGMQLLKRYQMNRPQRFGFVLFVLLAAASLAINVATRYSSTESATPSVVKTLHKHSSPEKSRQRLTKEAANWFPPRGHALNLQAPTSYPRIAPAGPTISGVIFETCLYNRPPPIRSQA